MGGLGGRRETAHNGRPRRTIGRLCCSIARNAGVRYAPLCIRRSPFRGSSSFGLERGPRPLGRGPEAPTIADRNFPIPLPHMREINNTNNKHNPSRGQNNRDGCSYVIEKRKEFFRCLCLLDMPTAGMDVSRGVGTAETTPRGSASSSFHALPTRWNQIRAGVPPSRQRLSF